MDKGCRNIPFYPFITGKSEQHKKDWGYNTEKDRGGSFQEPYEKVDQGVFQIKQASF